MKTNQYKQAEFLDISPGYLSRLLNGKAPFNYKVGERLSKVLPGDVIFWKNANPGQLRLALNNVDFSSMPDADSLTGSESTPHRVVPGKDSRTGKNNKH